MVLTLIQLSEKSCAVCRLDEIFDPSNIKKKDGFVIEEGTTSQDSYEGQNLLGAGYISVSFPPGKFDISAGFRGEYNVQTA